MSTAETAKLIASLSFDDKLTPGVSKAVKSVDRLDSSFSKMAKSIGGHVSKGMSAAARNVEVGIVAIGGAVASQVAFGLQSLAAQESANAQTAAAIRSTGAAAHVTAAQVEELSQALEDKTTIDNKEVQAAANLMLTFTNVRNEVGRGNDVFNQSVAVLTDMGTALGTDTSAAAIQLGKALNDPVKGITALTRVGVTFDAQQVKTIKSMVKAGNVLGAQKIILAELNKEFGGSAAAQADTYAGKMRRLGDAVEGAQQSIAEGMLPALTELGDEANKFLRDPSTIAAIKGFGTDLAGGIRTAVTWLKSGGWDGIASALKSGADAAKTLIGAFLAMPSWLQELLAGGFLANKLTGGAVAGIVGELGKGLIKGVLGMNAGVVNVNAAVVNGGGLPVAGAAGGGAAGGGVMAAVEGIVLSTGGLAVIAAASAAVLAAEGWWFANNAKTPATDRFNSQPGNPGASTPYGRPDSEVKTVPELIAGLAGFGGSGSSGGGWWVAATRDLGYEVDNAVKQSWRDAAATIVAGIRLGQFANSKDLLAGITARSAAEHGGKALGQSAINATFTRDIVHKVGVIEHSGYTSAQRLAALQTLARTADGHSTAGSAAVRAAINSEKARLASGLSAVESAVKGISVLTAERGAHQAGDPSGRTINVTAEVTHKSVASSAAHAGALSKSRDYIT